MQQRHQDQRLLDPAQPQGPSGSFSTDHPIDFDYAMGKFSSNHKLLESMLQRFESNTLNKTLEKMAFIIDQIDMSKLGSLAGTLKDACVFVGAGRLHHTCREICQTVRSSENSSQRALELYQLLVEECIAFKRYFRTTVQKASTKQVKEPESARTVTVSKGYRLQHDQTEDKFYCLRDDQSLEQRRAQAAESLNQVFQNKVEGPQQIASNLNSQRRKSQLSLASSESSESLLSLHQSDLSNGSLIRQINNDSVKSIQQEPQNQNSHKQVKRPYDDSITKKKDPDEKNFEQKIAQVKPICQNPNIRTENILSKNIQRLEFSRRQLQIRSESSEIAQQPAKFIESSEQQAVGCCYSSSCSLF